ncbi:MAG: ribonuclease Z [Oscillospiraceae bacterium]|nr:ribonuclease Z [Oscillospiraceae bacterium]
MTVYVCLDDRGGMLFNRRRQSRDAAVLEDIRTGLPDHLFIDSYSEKLISEAQLPFLIAPEDLGQLPENSHFFCECRSASLILPSTDTLVIYRWNRHYPSDFRWDADPGQAGFILTQTLEFPGKSHEVITKEVYKR